MTELAAWSRWENPILAPVFDELRTLVDYTELCLHKVEGDWGTVITYRGLSRRIQAVSLSFTPTVEDIWRRALDTGAPVIGEDSDVQAIANGRKPLEELFGVAADSHPKSQLTVPLRRGGAIAYLLTLWHVKPHQFTLQHTGRPDLCPLWLHSEPHLTVTEQAA